MEQMVVNPYYALGIAVIILLALYLFLWPDSPLVRRIRRFLVHTRRAEIEDALKFLYECEQTLKTCDQSMLMQALDLTDARTEQLIEELLALQLIEKDEKGIRLNEQGIEYALRVVRLHRLWERYLAEQTSIPEDKWHAAAELKEHQLNMGDARRLSRELGNPLYDPHGDPIPTEEGIVPPFRGIPLTQIEEGQSGRIVQFEDEPEGRYSFLRSQGLALGAIITLKKKEAQQILLSLNGRDLYIPLWMGPAVFVQPLDPSEIELESLSTLLALKNNEKGRVIGISRACRGPQRRRLMDLGVVPGTVISKELSSLGGDPAAYKIKDTLIALRSDQAKMIQIQKLQENEHRTAEKEKANP